LLASRSRQEEAEANLNAAHAIDTVVRAGEVLYIPSYWIHYIVSLKYSIQCNTRSGAPPNEQGAADVRDCVRVLLLPRMMLLLTVLAQVGGENLSEEMMAAGGKGSKVRKKLRTAKRRRGEEKKRRKRMSV